MVHSIKSLVERQWTVKVVHVYGERNRVVDAIANSATGLPLGVHAGVDPSLLVQHVLLEDAQRRAIPR